MTTPLHRARLAGIGLTAVVFVGGVVVGSRLSSEGPGEARLLVRVTDELPSELERLDLGPDQRVRLSAAVRRGRDRVVAIVDRFDPAMQAAVDSTEREIRSHLTTTQRAAFDSARRVNGPPLRRHRISAPERDRRPGP